MHALEPSYTNLSTQAYLINCSWMVHGVGAIGIHLNNVYHPVIKKIPDYRLDRANMTKSKDEIKKWLGVLEKHLDDRRTFICGEKLEPLFSDFR